MIPPYFFGLIPDIIKTSGETFVKNLASDSVKKIKSGVIRQTFKHKPLTQNYLRWKKRRGYDPRILIRTRFFLDNVGSFKEPSKRGTVYRVGVKNLQYVDGKSLQVIARYLEYGTSRMPARPVFRPTSREISAKIHTHILSLVKLLNTNLKKKLPSVQLEQMLNRVLKTGDSGLVQQRRILTQSMMRKRTHVR